MAGTVRAVTFDLWDTVFRDDSDEPKRADAGLLSKYLTRRKLVYQFLNRHQAVTQAQVDASYTATDAAFRKVWYDQGVTWSVTERLSIVLKGLERTLPEEELAELVLLHEEMELEIQPDLAPGIIEAIHSLHGRYKLGVISDAIFSPGRVLRRLLAANDLENFFDVFIFSDEIGCSKPDSKTFMAAAEGLGVDVREIAHVGDRDSKDIKGPQQLGAKGIYSTVINDRGSSSTSADAVCTDYSQLADIIDSLAQK